MSGSGREDAVTAAPPGYQQEIGPFSQAASGTQHTAAHAAAQQALKRLMGTSSPPPTETSAKFIQQALLRRIHEARDALHEGLGAAEHRLLETGLGEGTPSALKLAGEHILHQLIHRGLHALVHAGTEILELAEAPIGSAYTIAKKVVDIATTVTDKQNTEIKSVRVRTAIHGIQDGVRTVLDFFGDHVTRIREDEPLRQIAAHVNITHPFFTSLDVATWTYLSMESELRKDLPVLGKGGQLDHIHNLPKNLRALSDDLGTY